MRGLLLVLALTLLSGAVYAADGRAGAKEMADLANATSRKLIDASSNLNQMRRTVSVTDYNAVEYVMGALSDAECAIARIDILATLYSRMVSDPDRALFQSVLKQNKPLLIKLKQNAINKINLELPRMTVPALISESERARETIQQFKVTFESWSP